jgi:hypothetical protein
MNVRTILVLALCLLYFIVAGLILIPYAGFQHDEVVFAQPLYEHGVTFYSKQLAGMWVPMMINSYAGALKTWIYLPILRLWTPSAYSLRVPAMLIAALAMVLFWPIMVRAGGTRAATIAMVLLATDSMYLMTSAFDWGPCALQHFFLVAVMLVFIRYHETSSPALLVLGSFLAGLAVWEKALFLWLGAGLVVAGLILYPKQIFRHFSVPNLAIAGVSFVIGALPFLMYNIHKPNSTLGENTSFDTEHFDEKLEAAKRTFNSHAMFSYIVYDDWYEPPRAPHDGLESASLALRSATGIRQQNAMLWAYALGILLMPFAWRTRAWRPILFAIIFCAVGWSLMLITANAGASVHHVILLWPVTVLFLALSFSEASRRLPAKIALPLLGVVVAFFAASNVLATNEYLAQFVRDGPTQQWTNAIYPLSDDLLRSRYGEVDGIDWGTTVPLEVLDHGQLPLGFVGVDENAPQEALEKMGKDGVLFLGHLKELEIYPGVDEKLDKIAATHGMSKQVLKTFPDGNGRPVFELFQYHATAPDEPRP